MTVDIAALREALSASVEFVSDEAATGGKADLQTWLDVVHPELTAKIINELIETRNQLEAAQARIAELEQKFRDELGHRLIQEVKSEAIDDANLRAHRAEKELAKLLSEQEPVGYRHRMFNHPESWVYVERKPKGKYAQIVQPLYTAPPKPVVKLPDYIQRISESLKTQDNRITDQPMFVVFEKREIIGSDEHSPSRIAWCRDGEEVSELRAKRLEALHQDCRGTLDYYRYAMQEIDVFVTACFTEQGCKDYLSLNGHNLRLPYIFAAGSYRNNEYQQVRNWIISGCTTEGE